MPTSIKDSQISIRLPNALKVDMGAYAELTGRSASHVTMEALKEYLSWRQPQIEDLKRAIADADRGLFASDAEVRAVIEKYVKPVPRKTPRRR